MPGLPVKNRATQLWNIHIYGWTPCLRDAEDDEDVAEGGEDGEEDDGEAPVVDGEGQCRIEAVEE